jgi:hypothetical protein
LVDDKPVDGVQLKLVAPLAVNVTLLPAQIVELDGEILTVGMVFTVTGTEAVAVHPLAAVPVTVYVVVVAGVAVTTAVLVAESPVDGAQLYVLAPLAVSVTLLPIQIAGADGLMSMVGAAFTVTVTTEVPIPPKASVPITVYAVVVVGFATTDAPVVADSPVAGLQE